MEHQPTKGAGASDHPLAFQSLSSGIGLGALRAASEGQLQSKEANKRSPGPRSSPSFRAGDAKTARSTHPLVETKARPAIAAPALPSATGVLPGFETKARTPLSGKGQTHIWTRVIRPFFERFMLTFGIDLLFVAVSIFVVVLGSTLINQLRAEKGTPMSEVLPLAWILGQEIPRLFAGFFAVYLVYVVAFLVCAGATLGAISIRPAVKGPK